MEKRAGVPEGKKLISKGISTETKEDEFLPSSLGDRKISYCQISLAKPAILRWQKSIITNQNFSSN
jgi:hypothetical protein